MTYIVDWFDTEQRFHSVVIKANDERMIPFILRKMFGRKFNKVRKVVLREDHK